MNKKLLTVVVGATLAVVGGTANAFEAKLSGHLARIVMIADDGQDSQTYHVDATSAPSRFRFTASEDIVPGVKAGVNWEMGFNSNASGSVSQLRHSTVNSVGTGTTGNLFVSERQQEIYFQGAFGTLKFGQGDGASKDGNAVDLSGTAMFNGGQPADIGGGLLFRDAAGGISATSPSVASAMTAYEGARFDRIRYDSPALGPVVVSASTGYADNNDWTDFAVRVNQDMGPAGKIAAAIYYNKVATTIDGTNPVTNGTGNTETTGFSASWLASFGLSVTLAYAAKEDEHPTQPLDGKFTRLKVGYTTGEHSVSVDYAMAEDQIRAVSTDDETKEYSLAYSWKPKTWAEIFAGVKVYSFERPSTGTTFDDITVVAVGSRLVF